MSQGTLRTLGRKGDEVVTWDTEVEEAVKEAERIFEEKTDLGYAAFQVENKVGERIKLFYKEAEEIMLIPPMQGG